jgi:DNA-binding transcriptional regulator YhcF (GntR family)
MSHVTPVIPFRLVVQPGVPIADQVVFAAKKAILGGKLLPGDAFPSVRTLARETKIHANTAQKVIAQLASEGLIEVKPGIGTVVCRSTVQRGNRTRLLAAHVDQLIVQAMQLGVSYEELQSVVEEGWHSLAGKAAK